MFVRAIRSALLVAALALVPASALAQGTPWFVGGLGGITFGTVTSSAVGAQFGRQIHPSLFVIGEVGRMQNIMPKELDDLLDELAVEFDVPITFDISAPATYAFGGVRFVQARQAVSPFIEGGIGFGRININVGRVLVDGDDFTSDFREFIGSDTSETEMLIAIGGGVHGRLRGALGLDAGYRFTRIGTGDGVNVSMIYAAIKWSR
jgi:hypothetical protein